MVDGAGRVLLMRRADDRTWRLPGGGVEPDESWSQAAVRECLEETGWLVGIDGVFGVYSDPKTQKHTYPDGRQVQFLSVVFQARLVERAGEPSEESTDVGFFKLAELPEPFFESDRPIIADLCSGKHSPFIR